MAYAALAARETWVWKRLRELDPYLTPIEQSLNMKGQVFTACIRDGLVCWM